MSEQPKAGLIQEYWQSVRAFSPSMRRFLLSTVMIFMAFFGILAVLLNLYLLRLGFDARFIGLMLGVGQIVWALAALPAGLLSNRIGVRNSMMVGFGLSGLGLAMIPLVENFPESQWRTWLLLSMAVEHLGAAFFTVNFAPYMMAVTGEKERRHAFAVFQAVNPAMGFLGSLIAGLLPLLFARWLGLTLEHPAPYRLALWAGPLLLWGAILPLLGADPGRVAVSSQQRRDSGPAPIKWFIFLGVFVFVQAIGEGVVRPFFNVYLDTMLAVPTAQIGFIMGTAQLLPILAALSAPLLIARFGTGYALAIAIIGLSFCMLPFAAEPQLGIAALAYMGCIAMITVTSTSRDLFGQEMVTFRWRATSAGVLIVGLALGWATAGIVGGYLIETVGFGSVFLTGAVLSLCSVGLLVGFLRRRVPIRAVQLS
ncbi:MFS transporter [Chloroflexota bacterium]